MELEHSIYPVCAHCANTKSRENSRETKPEPSRWEDCASTMQIIINKFFCKTKFWVLPRFWTSSCLWLWRCPNAYLGRKFFKSIASYWPINILRVFSSTAKFVNEDKWRCLPRSRVWKFGARIFKARQAISPLSVQIFVTLGSVSIETDRGKTMYALIGLRICLSGKLLTVHYRIVDFAAWNPNCAPTM